VTPSCILNHHVIPLIPSIFIAAYVFQTVTCKVYISRYHHFFNTYWYNFKSQPSENDLLFKCSIIRQKWGWSMLLCCSNHMLVLMKHTHFTTYICSFYKHIIGMWPSDIFCVAHLSVAKIVSFFMTKNSYMIPENTFF
jgi:hypothetical protein